MRLYDILNQSIISIFRSKQNLTLGIITVVSTVLIMFSLISNKIYDSYIENYYNKNIGFRTLNVFYADDTEKTFIDEKELKKVEHVIEVLNSKYHSFYTNSSFKTKFNNGIINLTSATANIHPQIIKGEQIANQRNVAICPSQFYPDSLAENFELKDKTNNIINGQDLIGTTFDIKFNTYSTGKQEFKPQKDDEITRSFKIIGTYDTKQVMASNNQCYVNSKDIIEMVDKYYESKNESSVYVFVDDINNVENVMKEIKLLGYSAEVSSNFDTNIISNINLVFNLIITVAITIVVSVLILYVHKKMISELQLIGLKKALGYKIKDIQKLYFIENFIMNSMFYLTSSFIFILIFTNLKNTKLKFLNYYNFDVYLNGYPFMLTFLTLIVIPLLITSIVISQKIKLTTTKLLKFEE